MRLKLLQDVFQIPSSRILLFLSVFIICTTPNSALIGYSDVMDIIKLSTEVVGVLEKLEIMDAPIEADIPLAFVDDGGENALMGQLETINEKLDKIAERMNDVAIQNMMSTLIQNLPSRVRLELRLNDLLDYITRINANYRQMEHYTKNHRDFERSTMVNFATTVISHDPNSVVNLLERIHSFIVPVGKGITSTGLLDLLANSMREVEGSMVCNAKESPQQVFYNLYNAIALTELKGYTMVQFSYMLLRHYGNGKFRKEQELMKSRYQERTNKTVSTVSVAMKRLSRRIYTCDPKKHVRGKTYEEITGLIQGYITNEVDLHPRAECYDNCAKFQNTKSRGCYQNLYCSKQKNCNGRVIDCQYYDGSMTICPADSNSNRRYEYIKFKNGKTLATEKSCARGTTKVDSWWRYLFWHCSYCFCLCDEQGPVSERSFSTRAVIADLANNRVVTGLRFIRKNRIIHLQIQEAQLLPRLKVNASTVSWKPVNEFKITDKKVYSGKDYHTFTYDKRIMQMDDLEADAGYILTGVRFQHVGTASLNFQIHITKFDFENGTLITNSSKWKNNPNLLRYEVKLTAPDVPTTTRVPSLPDSKSNMYIKFTHSDIKDDAAQTVVPFLDVQNVESLQPVPLVGAGTYHKGRIYYGGFVGLKLITFDVSKHMKVDFSIEETKPKPKEE